MARVKKVAQKVEKKEAKKQMGKQEINKCPKCAKKTGFYVYLIPKKGAPLGGNFNLVLGCPKCSKRFRIGIISEKKK